MAQRTTPEDGPRLGRLTGAGPEAVNAVALVLPSRTGRAGDGFGTGATVRRLARALARRGASAGLATYTVRVPGGGDPVESAERAARWAADESVRRHGDVPLALAGAGSGARAALRAAGHEAVTTVLALAPRLPEDDDPAAEPEPVRHLAGRHVLLVHGTDDRRTDPELSFRLAERAKKANRDVCRFEAHTDGHSLRRYRSEILALSCDFTLGSLCGLPYARTVEDALAAPPPLGLRMPLAAGFGETLRG
ncbi:hypothetical protein STTU_4220 [Streptomyces sp. Tu6071]|uniref:Alpha/beta hydrolase n=2 Tax=Streptomyces TaxID=1883 RepID=A0ABD5E0M9_9ACTN|nr:MULTISPECIES: hypothetical protein [unclassified Streptomyces]ASY34654.1 alpha/beta hydrolase [Streptomyces sp. CLI2509]EGJ77009.1 hypothetical protein STTU_4220 [Streptomyces sp. Tu6071]MDT0414223.1 alpha/beta hydrolase [Streptomyces sp. DSM 41982]